MQQPLFADIKFRSPGISEDCLTLNVWTPAGAKPGARLPVLFYIHGGGAIAGDGSELRYDGAAMAQKGMVVVTINTGSARSGSSRPARWRRNRRHIPRGITACSIRLRRWPGSGATSPRSGATLRGSRSAARVRDRCRSAC
jgi:hypothetical protein